MEKKKNYGNRGIRTVTQPASTREVDALTKTATAGGSKGRVKIGTFKWNCFYFGIIMFIALFIEIIK